MVGGEYKTDDGFARRRFLANACALSAASVLGLARTAAAEPPPETTRLRLMTFPPICLAPQYLAETLLKTEGFTDIQYIEGDTDSTGPAVGPGKADIDMHTVAPLLTHIDAGAPVITLAGVHLGCYELFGTQRVRSIRDLKGKTVPVNGFGGSKHVLLSSMAAYVGLDPGDQARGPSHPQSRGPLRAGAGGRGSRDGRQGLCAELPLRAGDAKRGHYDAWRTYNPEDTMLFHALRLHEAGMIKTSPSTLVAQGSDWRFLSELKKELKA